MDSNSWYNDFFSPRDTTQSTVLPQYSVCLSVCDVQVPVPCTHRLEFFENNFTVEQLKAYVLADINMDDLVQREHPQNYGRIDVGPGAHKSCHIFKIVQDRTDVTIID